jgi:galactose mutarotase-like enzyme
LTTTLSNSNLTAQINHLGAELFSLKNYLDTEYIWEGNPEFWGKHSPVLFPIVGTLKNNTYQYQNQQYHLSRHGFAREMAFSLLEKTEISARFSIVSNAETLKVYPFDFELQIIYTLLKNSLQIEYKVVNHGATEIPFSIGAHPAFALPNGFENYSIEFQENEDLNYYLLENDLISNKTKKLEIKNKKVALNYDLFANDALIFKTLKSRSVTILENSNPIIKVDFEDFPSLGLWTKVKAPFLCIEPWLGYSDTRENSGNLFEKEGILVLEKNGTFESKFSVEIF